MRIEEVDVGAVLPQILHLRAAILGRRISLFPDIHAWSDPLDVRASHWCVFHDNALAAAARLSIYADSDGILSGLHSGDAWPLPVAVMSHCVVDPRFKNCHLDEMLDAARIERSHDLRCATLVAKPESLRRARILAALGFSASAGALVLDLTRADEPRPIIARRRPTG